MRLDGVAKYKMNFFEHQDKAIRSSKLLVFLFVLAVIAIVSAVYFPVQWAMFEYIWRYKKFDPNFVKANPLIWDYSLFLKVAGGTLAVILIGSAKKLHELAEGGQVVAHMMGGRLVDPATTDHKERQLLNVVEEMSIASGIPVPNVYLLDREFTINAFAAGYTVGDAVIGVTRGTIDRLNRDQLQGVIAHEFSHILHGDMKLNIRLMGLLYGILAISLIGRMLFSSVRNTRSNRKNGAGGFIFAGLILMIIGWIGYFFGRLIQAAVSRQREFLADASAVQYTRNPEGIGTALKIIAGYGGVPASGSHLLTSHREEISHMTFGEVNFGKLTGWTSSHPAIEDRIKAIFPRFNPKFEEKMESLPNVITQVQKDDPHPRTVKIGDAEVPVSKKLQYQPYEMIIEMAGTIPAAAIATQKQWLDTLDSSIHDACHHPQQAKAILYIFVGDYREDCRTHFESVIEMRDPAILPIFRSLWKPICNAGPQSRLKIVGLCMPSLRKLPLEEFKIFTKTLVDLINQDGKTSLFEFLLMKIVKKHLHHHFFPTKAFKPSIHNIHDVKNELTNLLLTLSQIDDADPAIDSAGAFTEGMKKILPQEPANYTSVAIDVNRLNNSLKVLEKTDFEIRKKLLGACEAVVQFDKKVTWKEMELLRAIGDSLDCPIPALH